MIDRVHDLPITKQAEVLRISRGSVYYLPRPVPEADLAIMRRLDRLHLEFPFAGSRMLRGLLVAEGCKIGRRHVKRLMQRMGIEALYRRPRTTKPEPGHKVYPYLLRGMAITRPNQVWAMDITYIPMARGFVYLAVVLDWFSRRVLSWRLSITMEAAFCIETLEDALARYGKPDVFNTDQGSQFTGAAFTGALASNGITISMDGKGAWRESWSRKSAQDDKWSFCLTAGTLLPANQERPCRDDRAGTTHRPSRPRWRLPPSKAIGHWRSLPSSSTFTPIRLHRGRRSLRAGLPMCSGLAAATPRHSRRST